MKYHNIHGELVTINTDLTRAKNDYQAKKQEHREGESTSMEINVASVVKHLKEMRVRPPTKKMLQVKPTNKNG